MQMEWNTSLVTDDKICEAVLFFFFFSRSSLISNKQRSVPQCAVVSAGSKTKLHRLKISYSDKCPCGIDLGPQTPQPHPAVLPHLRRFETPDMVQSGGCQQEALGSGWDTAADCGPHLTHRTEDQTWPGTEEEEEEEHRSSYSIELW